MIRSFTWARPVHRGTAALCFTCRISWNPCNSLVKCMFLLAHFYRQGKPWSERVSAQLVRDRSGFGRGSCTKAQLLLPINGFCPHLRALGHSHRFLLPLLLRTSSSPGQGLWGPETGSRVRWLNSWSATFLSLDLESQAWGDTGGLHAWIQFLLISEWPWPNVLVSLRPSFPICWWRGRCTHCIELWVTFPVILTGYFPPCSFIERELTCNSV